MIFYLVPSMTRRGLILLSTDYTLPDELKEPFADTRVLKVDRDITMYSLMALKRQLEELVFPSDTELIIFACTCASACLDIASILRKNNPNATIITPLSAAIELLRSYGSKIALVSPYIKEIEDKIINHLELNSLKVVNNVSFKEKNDKLVSKITPDQIYDAILKANGSGNPDVIFVSCTNLKFMKYIDNFEKMLGKPIVSSNKALCQRKIF